MYIIKYPRPVQATKDPTTWCTSETGKPCLKVSAVSALLTRACRRRTSAPALVRRSSLLTVRAWRRQRRSDRRGVHHSEAGGVNGWILPRGGRSGWIPAGLHRWGRSRRVALHRSRPSRQGRSGSCGGVWATATETRNRVEECRVRKQRVDRGRVDLREEGLHRCRVEPCRHRRRRLCGRGSVPGRGRQRASVSGGRRRRLMGKRRVRAGIRRRSAIMRRTAIRG